MARAYKLTWDSNRKRWKKKIKGKQVYFSTLTKGKLESYQEALSQYEQYMLKLNLSVVSTKEKALEARKEIIKFLDEQIAELHTPECTRLEIYDSHPSDEYMREQIEEEIQEIEDNPKKTLAQLELEEDPLTGEPKEVRDIWRKRLKKIPVVKQNEKVEAVKKNTIKFYIDEYLITVMRRVATGQISATHYQNTKDRLQPAIRFFGIDTPIKAIDGRCISKMEAFMLDKLAKNEIGSNNARQVIDEFIRWVKWLYIEEIIDTLPRVLLSRKRINQISVKTKDIVVFEIEEIQYLLKKLPEQLKLYFLLMLNCGMYQTDISDLKPSEIDWKEGRIIRKRSKTKDEKNVPVVNYKLWSETFRLLKKYRSFDDSHVLLNEAGKPLRDRELKDNGKVANCDYIGKTWQKFIKLNNFPKEGKPERVINKPLKSLRKTSSTILDNHEHYGRFAQYFLGQAPQSVASKHYIQPSRELFDKAILWLGEKFGV